MLVVGGELRSGDYEMKRSDKAFVLNLKTTKWVPIATIPLAVTHSAVVWDNTIVCSR